MDFKKSIHEISSQASGLTKRDLVMSCVGVSSFRDSELNTIAFGDLKICLIYYQILPVALNIHVLS